MSKKKYYLITFLLLFLSSSTFSQTVNVWGADASVGVSHGEFSNPISLTPTPTNWYSMMQYNDVLSTTVYWNQNLTGVSAATSNPTPTPIGSPSQANGVAIFDGAYLLETGIASSWGFSAYLISPQIDLTGFAGEPISVKFYAMKDGGWNDTRLSFSADDGATWSTALDWTYELPTGTDGWIDLDFPGSLTLGITDLTQCRLRFLSTGIPQFTLIDDLTLSVPCNDTYNNIIETAMNSYVSPSGNYTWTGTGIYSDTIPNITSCDSILTIDLTILNAQGPVYNITECNEFVSPSGNYTWNSNGTYVDTIPSALSGDSIITFNLTIDPSLNSNHNYSASNCDSYLSPSGNYSWSSSGIYLDTIPNAIGCDSVITVDLTIFNSHNNVMPITMCDEYQWAENGLTYNTSGTYSVTYVNQFGCDSLETLDLIIFESSSSATQNNETLFADSISDTYSWLDCLDNYNLVSTGTQQFTSTETGVFALVTESNGCMSDTSVCFLIDYAALESINDNSEVILVPNPTNDGIFTVQSSAGIKQIQVLDMMGRLIIIPHNVSNGNVDASSLESGKYLLRIITDKGLCVRQIVISK